MIQVSSGKQPHSIRPLSRGLFLGAILFMGILSIAATTQDQELARLPLGAQVEKLISSGETHRYSVDVDGSPLVLTAAEIGADLILRLRSPQGELLVEMASPGQAFREERIVIDDRTGGQRIIEVLLDPRWDEEGLYRLRLQPLDAEEIPLEHLLAYQDKLTQGHRAYRQEDTREARQSAVPIYLEAAQSIPSGLRKARATYWIGVSHSRNENFVEAKAVFEEALRHFQTVPDPVGQAQTLAQLGRSLGMQGHEDEAERRFQEAIGLDAGSEFQRAIILSNFASFQQRRGESEAARGLYDQALQAFSQIKAHGKIGNILASYSLVMDRSGFPFKANDLLEEAIANLRPKPGNRDVRATLWNNYALIHSHLGNKQAALVHYSNAYGLARQSDNRGLQCTTLINMGRVFLDLGRQELATTFLRQSLAVAEEIESPALEIAAIGSLGRAAVAAGEFVEAEQRFREVLNRRLAAEDLPGEAVVRIVLGDLQNKLGNFEDARDQLERALSIFDEKPNPRRRMEAHFHLGETWRSLSQTNKALNEHRQADKALNEYRKALEVSQLIESPADQVEILRQISRSRLERGELDLALKELKPALALVESQRVRVAGDTLRSSYFESLRLTYSLQVEILMRLFSVTGELKHVVQALEATESARARSLMDHLLESPSGTAESELQRPLSEWKLLRQEISHLHWRLSRSRSPEQRKSLTESLERKLAQWAIVDAQVASSEIASSQPASLAEIQRALGPNSTLLEYFIGQEASYLWIVGPDAVSSLRLPKEENLQELVEAAMQPIRQIQEFSAPLKNLSQGILWEALPHLKTQQLVVVADGPLNQVPFQLLFVPVENRLEYLLDRFEVVSAPSGSAMAVGSSRPAPDLHNARITIFTDPVFQADDPRISNALPASPLATEQATLESGNEAQAGSDPLAILGRIQDRLRSGLKRLRWTGREADAIRDTAGADRVTVFQGVEANRENAMGPQAEAADVLHFATHGLQDNRFPELTSLTLSKFDETGQPRAAELFPADILQMKIQADLVVLSACQSAIGRNIRGEGFFGLSRAFLLSDVSHVVSSLWSVDDRATAELMERFYKGLLVKKLSPSNSLRQAQLSMKNNPRWRHPAYWGAFVLQSVR